MNPLKLFNLSYLFDPTPGAHFMYFWPLVICLLLVFAASFKVKTYIKTLPNHHVAMEFLGNIPKRLRELAVVGLVLAFFRNENIPYFAIRFWTILLFALFAIYLFKVIRDYRTNFSVRVETRKEAAVIDKYLPRAKKKK